MSTKTVIDVSQFNGHINWLTVAKNVDAVIIRAGYRGYGSAGALTTDANFKTNIQGAVVAKIPVGVYWCSQALSDAEAIAEARYCHNLLTAYKLDYPVYLDSEHMGPNASGRADQIGKTRRTQYGLTFCRAMRDYGHKVGLYCSESWFADEIDGASFDRQGFDIWIAKYSSTKPKYRHDAWQHTDKGKVAGISGNVDMNHFYKEYIVSDFRKSTKQRFGFDDNTMEFLDNHPYAEALYQKLATKA